MSTKTLAEFLPEVLPHVEGCPEQIAKNAVRNAVIELCERASVWRYDLDPISTAPPLYEYDLNIPSASYLVDALRVSVDGLPIDPTTREDLDRLLPGWETQSADAIGYFLTPDKRKIRLAPTPRRVIGNGIRVEASLKPTRSATTIEEFLFEEHLEIIAAGARARIFAMPKQKWSDAVKAGADQALFDAGCAARNVSSAQSHSRAPLRVVPVYSLR